MSRDPRLALVLLGLSPGCRALAHEGPPALELTTPEAWVAGDGIGRPLEEDSPWWEGFGHPPLAAVVREALDANLDLRTSATRVAAAAAQARIAGAERLPVLEAGGNASRAKQIFVGLPVPGGGGVLDSTSTSYGVSLDVSWELDLWGRLAASSQAAEEDLVAALQDHRAARHSLAAQTAKAWFAAQEARLQEELALSSLASFETTRDLVQRRYDGGLVSAFELRLAETDVAGARVLVAERREQIERFVRQLELLLGRYPAGVGSGVADAPSLPETPVTPPAGFPGELIARRPDLAAAEARLAAADERLHAARAALYPTLSLSGSAGRTSDQSGDLFDSDFSVWSIAAGLTQPIFQGGRLRAGVDLADARVAEALRGFEAALLAALGEVEIALAAEDKLALLEQATRLASEEAEAARVLAQDRYGAGLTGLLEVLEVQRRALNNESAYLSTRRRRLDQRVDLHLALGGGFEADAEQSTAP